MIEFCCENAGCCSEDEKCKRPYKAVRIEKENLKQFKTFVSYVFVACSSENAGKNVLDYPIRLLIVNQNSKIIGTFCARADEVDAAKKLYISYLAVNLFWRRQGIGSAMIELANRFCEQDPDFVSMYLHVQKDNEDARAFYEHFGFVVTEEVSGFYHRTQCPTALVMEKRVRAASGLSAS